MKVNITIGIPVWLDKIIAWPVMVYRRWKYGYAYRRIYLGEGEYTIVEPRDYYWLKRYNWYLSGNGKEYYAFTNIKIGPGKTKAVGMHRLIMNPPSELLVDHHNNMPLDNRRENLRLATPSQNRMNRKWDKSKNLSKYKGVSFDKRRGTWNARICFQRKNIWLGRFDNEIDAAKAYDQAAKKYHKEFARLNFQENRENT